MNSERKPQVVVSLTSFPAAISYAVGAVKSILRGSVLPDRLVLYLTLADFGEAGVPAELLALSRSNPIFEIRDYGRDIRSYRKLVPALADFPEAVIVTVDDDIDYHPNLLRDLLRVHRANPRAIVAHRAKRILPGEPYRKWPKLRWYHFLNGGPGPSFRTMQTGVGGVLYPPGALKREMIDVELFTRLAPTSDDIWFWAAAVANDTPVIAVPFGHNKPRELGKPRSLSLKTVNFKSGTDRNDAAMKAILEAYPEVARRLNEA